jgi:hypothetical protein
VSIKEKVKIIIFYFDLRRASGILCSMKAIKKTICIRSVPLPVALYRAAMKAANEDGRTFSSWARQAIIEKLNWQGRVK